MASLRSPADLCERLGLKPIESEYQIMEKFEWDDAPLDVRNSHNASVVRTVALCALWRMMLNPDSSRVTVLASNRAMALEFFDFLKEITTVIDPALSSICRWQSRTCLRIGRTHGAARCRLSRTSPEAVQGLCSPNHTAVLLGAGSSDPDFVDTVLALRAGMVGEGQRMIRVW